MKLKQAGSRLWVPCAVRRIDRGGGTTPLARASSRPQIAPLLEFAQALYLGMVAA